MDSEKDILEESLISSIEKSDLRDTMIELFEIGLDSFIENEGAKSLPFLGSLYKLYRTGLGIRERIYYKKVAKFLFEISEVPEDQRKEFIAELDKNAKEKQRFQETTLIILERLDDLEKPTIVGRLSRALIQKRINLSTWQLLCHSVDRTFITDLKSLPDYYALGTTNEEIGEILVANRLMNRTSAIHENDEQNPLIVVDWNDRPITYVQTDYYLNDYGKLLVDIGLEK